LYYCLLWSRSMAAAVPALPFRLLATAQVHSAAAAAAAGATASSGGGQEGGRCGRFDTKVAAVVYLSAFVGFVVTVAAGYFCLYEHEDEQGNL
jgi:hypothetical protein